MTNTLILSIDQGTTSSRAILFTTNGEIHHTAQQELPLITPQGGWAEQDPGAIWNGTLACVQDCIARAKADNKTIAAIGITNQRETTIIWDKTTGEPIYNAIVWHDRRTAAMTEGLQHKNDTIRMKTGLLLDPYFSASKIKWILDHVQPTNIDNLLFGTVDTFLLWHLTGGAVHATDKTNASRTMLYNIHTLDWDDELLKLFDIPETLLPTVHDNVHEFGVTDRTIVGARIPILGMAGDQQAALIGQGCFQSGDIKSTYGTGCFMVMNTGQTPKTSQNGLLTTIGYSINGAATYALEGSIFTAGSLIQWLRDKIGIISDAAETDAIAKSIDDNGGVYLVPALTGLGAPHWNAEATALITGLRQNTGKAHIVRAALEAQAYQTHDLMDARRRGSGANISALRADGGLANNAFAMQHMADILDMPVHIPTQTEATAWGAAILAGIGAGVFESLEESAKFNGIDRTYTPAMNDGVRQICLNGWKTALGKV